MKTHSLLLKNVLKTITTKNFSHGIDGNLRISQQEENAREKILDGLPHNIQYIRS